MQEKRDGRNTEAGSCDVRQETEGWDHCLYLNNSWGWDKPGVAARTSLTTVHHARFGTQTPENRAPVRVIAKFQSLASHLQYTCSSRCFGYPFSYQDFTVGFLLPGWVFCKLCCREPQSLHLPDVAENWPNLRRSLRYAPCNMALSGTVVLSCWLESPDHLIAWAFPARTAATWR